MKEYFMKKKRQQLKKKGLTVYKKKCFGIKRRKKLI